MGDQRLSARARAAQIRDTVRQAMAALRLGDWFVPPEGSLIWYNAALYQVMAHRDEPVTTPAGRLLDSEEGWSFFRIRPVAPGKGGVVWIGSGIDYELLEVPEGCPPFEEWGRPRHD